MHFAVDSNGLFIPGDLQTRTRFEVKNILRRRTGICVGNDNKENLLLTS